MFDLDLTMVRLRHLTDAAHVVGKAVLRNYPLRLWAAEQEHFDSLLREFQLILGGSARTPSAVPQQLVDVADMFTTVFGSLIDEVFEDRRTALGTGLDRLDSSIPLVNRTPDLVDHLRVVLLAVDDYCRRGDLLTLARSPELIALSDWTFSELTTQFYGGKPTSWAGPF